MAACLDLCQDLRGRGTYRNLTEAVREVLHAHLPSDAHKRCSGVTHIAVTRALPCALVHVYFCVPFLPRSHTCILACIQTAILETHTALAAATQRCSAHRPANMRVNSKLSPSLPFADPRGRLVSEFASNDALVEALLTSSHLPFYSNGNPARRFDGAWHYDGGVANFLPGVPSADYNVRVCCFPSQNINLVRLLPFECEQCACWLRPRGPTASWRGCCGNRYCFALCACCLCKQSMHWTARISCVCSYCPALRVCKNDHALRPCT